MDYQLVLQFKGDSLADYDSMVALEDELIVALSGIAEVDGHDIGSGETNIFIVTPSPLPSFDRAKAVLERTGLLDLASVGYRPVTDDGFKVLWPQHQQAFSVA